MKIGMDLRKYEEVKWNTLLKHTIEVFRALDKKYNAALNEPKE